MFRCRVHVVCLSCLLLSTLLSLFFVVHAPSHNCMLSRCLFPLIFPSIPLSTLLPSSPVSHFYFSHQHFSLHPGQPIGFRILLSDSGLHGYGCTPCTAIGKTPDTGQSAERIGVEVNLVRKWILVPHRMDSSWICNRSRLSLLIGWSGLFIFTSFFHLPAAHPIRVSPAPHPTPSSTSPFHSVPTPPLALGPTPFRSFQSSSVIAFLLIS